MQREDNSKLSATQEGYRPETAFIAGAYKLLPLPANNPHKTG